MAKTLLDQIVQRIHTILDKKEWKQADLARETGFHKGYISLLLSGQKNLTVETIEILEKALKEPIVKVPK